MKTVTAQSQRLTSTIPQTTSDYLHNPNLSLSLSPNLSLSLSLCYRPSRY